MLCILVVHSLVLWLVNQTRSSSFARGSMLHETFFDSGLCKGAAVHRSKDQVTRHRSWQLVSRTPVPIQISQESATLL